MTNSNPAVLTGVDPVPSARQADMQSRYTIAPKSSAEAVGLEPTSSQAAPCFRDKALIQPDDFRRLRGLESNQRPLASKASVAASGNRPGLFAFLTFLQAARFGEKESNLHCLIQSQAAYR